MQSGSNTKLSANVIDQLIKIDPQLKFLPELISLCEKLLEPEKIILFGSRARGDFLKSSDVDLAFAISEKKRDCWARFVAEVDENLKTLLKLDLVRLDQASDAIKRSVEKEGIAIYG